MWGDEDMMPPINELPDSQLEEDSNKMGSLDNSENYGGIGGLFEGRERTNIDS